MRKKCHFCGSKFSLSRANKDFLANGLQGSCFHPDLGVEDQYYFRSNPFKLNQVLHGSLLVSMYECTFYK